MKTACNGRFFVVSGCPVFISVKNRSKNARFYTKMYPFSNRFNTKSKQLCTPRWQVTMAQNGIAKGGRQFDQYLQLLQHKD